MAEWLLGPPIPGNPRGILQGRRILLALVTVSIAFTMLAYGPVLSFPFTFDDPIHLRWLEGRGVFEPWTGVSGLQRYRPLVLSLWAVFGIVFGPHNPLPLHAVSLLLHISNATMAGWLAYQFVSGEIRAIVAAALFAVFPFSYQALPSPGSQSKPLSAFLILAACVLYWLGRTRDGRALVTVSVLAALLAPFAYEGGATAGGALLLMEYLLWRKGIVARPAAWSLALLLVGSPFVVVWALVPKSSDLTSFPGWEALWQNSVYFAQALTWPASLLARPLMRWTHLADQAATTLVAYPALALLAYVFFRRHRADVFLACVAWYVLALVVQGLVLPFGYVIDGPRILYTASVGVVWLWTDLLTLTLPVSRIWWAGAAVGAVVIAMTSWSLSFIMERVELCQTGLSVLSEASERVIERPQDSVQLFLNLPSWVAPRRRGFALGHEGYTLLPEYTDVGLDDFVYVNTGVRRTAWVMSLPDIRDQWRAEIGYYGEDSSLEGIAEPIRRADRVWVMEVEGDALALMDVGSVGEGAVGDIAEEDDLAVFAEAIGLRDLRIREPDSVLAMQLDWQSLRAVSEPYTVFVHLYDANGQLVAQGDGFPLGGTFPFVYWEPGDRVRDVRHIELPEGLRVEDCVVGVGLYRSDIGERAPAVDAQGDALANQMYRARVAPIQGG